MWCEKKEPEKADRFTDVLVQSSVRPRLIEMNGLADQVTRARTTCAHGEGGSLVDFQWKGAWKRGQEYGVNN